MSELSEELANVNDGQLGESLAAMERRHKVEIRKLEGETRALLKTAKKSNRAVIEAQVIQMQYDLKERHKQERDELEALGENTEPVAAEEPDLDENISMQTAEEIAQAKKEKAKKKQDKRKAKDAERIAIKQTIQEENSGPSSRDIELERINQQLSSEQLHVKAILSDGNCLYRAVADQLQLVHPSTTLDFNSLRSIAASYMRAHPEDFCPFLGMELGDPAFESYCDRVESTVLAEWGGQLELKALSVALQRPIHVYSADAPVLCMDSEGRAVSDEAPLRVAFHRHYYALGEHYNSVTPL